MLSIDEYLDKAKHTQKLKSDRQLSAALGVKGSYITFYRTKRSWPSDALMIKIAELANEDPQEALLNLNIWRNADSAAASMYSNLLDKLKIAAMLCLAGGFIVFSLSDLPAYSVAGSVASVAGHYILCKILACAILVSGFTNMRFPTRVYI